MNQNKKGWRQSVFVSKFPLMLLVGILISAGTFSFAQTNANIPMARMMHDNSITIRTGLNGTYKIPIGHMGFTSTQEAVDYFQARDVDYIDFTVVDVNTVLMEFDLNDPAVANWTLADWNKALATRAENVPPRPLNY